jgi:recombination protein RecT
MTDEKAIQVSKKPELRAIMRSDQITQRFEEITGKGHAGGYISSVLIAVSQNQDLMNCTPNSIIGSALRAATLELSVDPSIGQAYLVPFKGKATLIVGYKGLYQMAIRTGKYRYLNLMPIYEDDDLTEDRSTGILILKYGNVRVIPERRTRRDQIPAGYLLYMELKDGFKKSVFMTCQECDDHGKKYSKTYDLPNGLWKKDPHKMYQKTVIRQGITHWGYLDPHDLMNMGAFDEGDDEETDYMKGVEIKELPHRSVEESLAELGYDEREEKEITSNDGLTYNQAYNTKSSNGTSYGTFTDKELNHHKISIEKKMRGELSQEEQDECINKLEAIKVLLSFSEAVRLKKDGQQSLPLE